jgi:hypothetical protein
MGSLSFGQILPVQRRSDLCSSEKPNKEINATLADPKMKTRFVELGGTMLAVSTLMRIESAF